VGVRAVVPEGSAEASRELPVRSAGLVITCRPKTKLYKNDPIKIVAIRTASSPLSQVRLRQLVQGLAAREEEWLSLVRCDLGRRWYQRLTCADDHEVWLLSWLPGQRTGFHDHGESSGAFRVARGTLRERAAPGCRPGPPVPVRRGTVRSFGPRYVHDVINASVRPAVSVHAYSPPLSTMRRFESGAAGLVQVGVETAVRW
jgi:predicted metal-dependent enzyme (double-stranded beta helix superfamily)